MSVTNDYISRQDAINEIDSLYFDTVDDHDRTKERIKRLPTAQPEYEPVKAEDFAKTMSKNTLYSFMAWHGEALELIERQGFVICKKTM